MEKNRGGNLGIDNSEPEKIARMVESLGLGYVVITSVTRDDLVDGGVAQFCRTLELIHALGKDIKIELLIPDFNANPANLRAVVAARPRVIGHNIETVARLHRELKPSCDYCISLKVLSMIKTIEPAMLTKSSILLGLGEKEEEIISTLRDLREAGCDMVVLGQYLSPSKQHYPVREFVAPEKFRSYQNQAAALGFKTVISSPLARSSYRAEELYEETLYA
jgi:lipoic acid synthetase